MRIGCGLDGPDFEYRHGQEVFLFSDNSRPFLGPTQPHVQWVLGLFLGVNRSRSSSTEVKNKGSYTYTSCIPSWGGQEQIYLL